MTPPNPYGPLEDETCRRFVLPKVIDQAGWERDRVRAAYPVNRGRITPTRSLHRQDRPLIADYVLEHSDGLPIAVIEAKRSSKDPADGVEQAKRYARLLDVPFAYSTNGQYFIEVDGRTGLLTRRADFPAPEELWVRYKDERGIDGAAEDGLAAAPLSSQLRNWDGTPKAPRYYQQAAINRVVQAIAKGERKMLLVLATGTGKTLVAAQIVAKLWNANWPTGHRPRVLYLADRNILIDQPKDEYFQRMFRDAVWKLNKKTFTTSRNIYFALYQALDGPSEDAQLYRQFDKDFFDLVIVDECHRSSAAEDSQWHEILKYFEPAVQIGLTATPVSSKDADTYGYFGEPLYEYSLAQGIEDGFLAPYRVRRVMMNIDVTGWAPEPGQLDLHGREIPYHLYGPREYERLLVILERTEEAARYLTDYMSRTGRMNKTIVFCQDVEHAQRMTEALHNANRELSGANKSIYVCRITGDDGDPGRELLDKFRAVDEDVPVIAVTSRLLSTGIDIPTLRNIVLFRVIRSIPEFKQIIGRGTRLFPEGGKLSFDIVDFVSATRLFNDPLFDGPPLRLLQDYTDPDGTIANTVDHSRDIDREFGRDLVTEPPSDYQEEPGGSLFPDEVTDEEERDRILATGRKYYVDGVDVVRVGTMFYLHDPAAGGLKLKEFSQFVRDRVLELRVEPYELLNLWAGKETRKNLRDRFGEWGVTADDLAEWAGRPDADPVDLLLYIAWELPVLSRAERARRVELKRQDFFKSYAEDARDVLTTMLKRYAAAGPEELDTRALQSAAYRPMGTVTELSRRFGGGANLNFAVDKLSELIYSTA